jgi:hypothetical protein
MQGGSGPHDGVPVTTTSEHVEARYNNLSIFCHFHCDCIAITFPVWLKAPVVRFFFSWGRDK